MDCEDVPRNPFFYWFFTFYCISYCVSYPKYSEMDFRFMKLVR